jgi:hypothetical protein
MMVAHLARKLLLKIIWMSLLFMVFSSCDNSINPPPVKDFRLSISEWTAPDSGGVSQTIEITSVDSAITLNWSVCVDSSWLSVDPASGTTPGSFAITTDSNATGFDRRADIKIAVSEVDDSVKTIDVSQSSMSGIYLVGSYDTQFYARTVFVEGDYAFTAGYNCDLKIIDISDPTNPILAGLCESPDSVTRIVVEGNYAYVTDINKGLQIIDISSPSMPNIVCSFKTPGKPQDVFISGDLAYVGGENGGLQILDISDPYNPAPIGCYDTLQNVFRVVVSDNYALMSSLGVGLEIIDISNPNDPLSLSSIPGTFGSIFVKDQFIFLAGWRLLVYDISNPSIPAFIGEYGTIGLPTDVIVADNYAFISGYVVNGGIQTIDITDPYDPVITHKFKQEGFFWDIKFADGYIYSASGSEGLKIFKFVP